MLAPPKTHTALEGLLDLAGIKEKLEDADFLNKKMRAGALLDAASKNETSKIQDVTINWSIPNIERDGAVFDLTEKECALLKILFDADEKSTSHAWLLQKVWGYSDDLDTHTLQTHIYRLRQKLEQDPTNPQILRTVNDGYCLNIKQCS